MMQERILELIKEINPYEEVESDTRLLEEILDSMTLVILINELEGEFNITIPENMLRPELFETVDKIAELVESLQGEKSEKI